MKKRLKTVVLWCFWLLVWLLFFWCFGLLLGRFLAQTSPIKGIAYTILAFILSIAVHEAGHLVFGLLSGYRVASYRLFRWMWYKDSTGWHYTTFSLPGTLGQCLMIPPAHQEYPPYFWYLAGGGLANLIFAALMGGLALMTSGSLSAFGGIHALVNVVGAIVNLVPTHKPISNDGHVILSLIGNKKAQKALALQLFIADCLIRGEYLQAIDDKRFVYSEPEEWKNEYVAISYTYLIAREVAKGNDERAYEQLQEFLASDHLGLSTLLQDILRMDVVYYDLVNGRLDKIAEQSLKKLQKTAKALSSSQLSAPRFLYAYEKIYCRNLVEAEKYAKKFNQLTKTIPYKGEIATERRLLTLAQTYEPEEG